jgi:hypothetical protein
MTTTYGSPIEVWLRVPQDRLSIDCTVVREDESGTGLSIDSASMRGAQREITTYLIEQGYKPAGRWVTEDSTHDSIPADTWRRFKLEA